MDAFAVSIVKGLCMERIDRKAMLAIAAAFGGFQGLMPMLGYALGSVFAARIARYDHWIAFGLLAFIGIKMIIDAIRESNGEPEESGAVVTPGELLLLAVATSIDALAVGVTFSFLEVYILSAAAIIALTTFCISAAGVVIGHLTGSRFRLGSQILGGVILVLLGVKILFG